MAYDRTKLVIKQIFRFYEGQQPSLYTPLTGKNLNKTPEILAEALDDVISRIGTGGGGGGGGPQKLSDSVTTVDSTTGASSTAAKTLYDMIQEIKNNGAGLKETTDLPKGEIPKAAKIPVTYVGEAGDKYLAQPREWVEITTKKGKGLVPVYAIGTITDNR